MRPSSQTYRFISGLAFSQQAHRFVDELVTVRHPFPFPAELDGIPDAVALPRQSHVRPPIKFDQRLSRHRRPHRRDRRSIGRSAQQPRVQGRYALDDTDDDDDEDGGADPSHQDGFGDDQEDDSFDRNGDEEEYRRDRFGTRDANGDPFRSSATCAIIALEVEPSVLMIGFGSGKIDVGVLLDKIEPSWVRLILHPDL